MIEMSKVLSLVRGLRDPDPEIRKRAVEQLHAGFGDLYRVVAETIPHLIRGLTDEDKRVSDACMHALRALGPWAAKDLRAVCEARCAQGQDADQLHVATLVLLSELETWSGSEWKLVPTPPDIVMK